MGSVFCTSVHFLIFSLMENLILQFIPERQTRIKRYYKKTPAVEVCFVCRNLNSRQDTVEDWLQNAISFRGHAVA
jgi:hypothetical protein